MVISIVSAKMAAPGTEKKEIKVKYKKIHLKDLQFDQGDNFYGRGQFGDVKKAKWNGKVVAVKCFATADRKGGFSEELVCLSRLQPHSNIVIMHGACVAEQPFIVLEFAPLSLEKVLHELKKEYRYTADHVISWSYQMATALEYIHGIQMLHRDIKPSNILLFDKGKMLKLCDFGTAKKLEHTLTNAVGTIRYMAPEVIRGRYYTDRCDVFSFGIVIWEMIARKIPCLTVGKGQQHSNMAILYAMANGARPPPIRNIPKVISEMISKCWDEEPQKRPPMKELKHKLAALCRYVETSKPLIQRRQKQKKEEQTQSDVFIAPKMSTQIVNPEFSGADGPADEDTPPEDKTELRGRSDTAPEKPANLPEPIPSPPSSLNKQVSSPAAPGLSPSHGYTHSKAKATNSVPVRGVEPGTGSRWNYGHQESEYGEIQEEVLGEVDLVQKQSQRYAGMKEIMKFIKAVEGSTPYAIPGLESELQPFLPDETVPGSMDLYRKYRSVAEQVVKARKEFRELEEERVKLEREIKEDRQKLEENKTTLQEYQAHCNERDHLVGELQKLQDQLGQLRAENNKLAK